MILENKTKATNNRTITLTPQQRNLNLKSVLKPADYLAKDLFLESELRNKIIQGNTLEVLDKIPAQFCDLIFVDPPYNLSKQYSKTAFKKQNEDDYEDWLDQWVSSLKTILKPQGSLYICCDWQSSSSIYRVAKKYFHAKNRITWEREKGRGAQANWKNCIEDIWFFTNSEDYYFNIDAVKIKKRVLAPYKNALGDPKDWKKTEEGNFRYTHPSNVWTDITIPFWSMPENTDHPTQKSEKLLAKIILASSRPGDIIFDPFLGSGTTAVVAQKLNRQFLGIENEEEYCALAVERLLKAEKNPTIQGYEEGVFLDRNFKISR